MAASKGSFTLKEPESLTPYSFELAHSEASGSSSSEHATQKRQDIIFYYRAMVQKVFPFTEGAFSDYKFSIPHINVETGSDTKQFSLTKPRMISVVRLSRDAQRRSIPNTSESFNLVYKHLGDPEGSEFNVVSIKSAAFPATSFDTFRLLINQQLQDESRKEWAVFDVQTPLEICISYRLPISFLEPYAQRRFACPLNETLALKVSLLDEAAETGDVNLICKDGSKVPAHAAILASIPYFKAKLKADWSGVQWNPNNKLDLALPCHVDTHVVHVFLSYAYGDPSELHQVEPTQAQFLQVLISLAEAVGYMPLCENIIRHVVITDENQESWLEWAAKEHGLDVRKIVTQAGIAVKRSFKRAGSWENMTAQQLVEINRVVKKSRTEESTEG